MHLEPQSTKADLTIILLVTILTIFGLVMVYDASVIQAFRDYNDKYFYIKQQVLWVLLGFVFMGLISFINYHFLKKIAVGLIIFSLLLLIAVFTPLGISVGGAHRWLNLGFITLQPTEVIKLTSIIFFSSIFEKKVKFLPFILLLSLVCLIVGLYQKDLGSVIIFSLTSFALYFIAGAPIKHFLLLIPAAFLGLIFFIASSAYRRARILAFLDPFADPQGYTYHISQVLLALGSGGLFGLGLGQSRQKFEYIPEVTTDSIFAIVGEEFGFLGATLLIILIGILVYKGFKIAENAPDQFGRILAFGITFWLGIQSAVNLAAMVSLVPLTGVPLPFISYGGSALLTNLIGVGILLNISKASKDQV